MKTALVTKDRYVFVPSSAEVLLKDDDYLKLMVDLEFRKEFLDSLGVSKLYVQRLGWKKSEYYTSRDRNVSDAIGDMYRMEVGVIARV